MSRAEMPRSGEGGGTRCELILPSGDVSGGRGRATGPPQRIRVGHMPANRRARKAGEVRERTHVPAKASGSMKSTPGLQLFGATAALPAPRRFECDMPQL